MSKMRIKYDFKIFSKRKKIVWIGLDRKHNEFVMKRLSDLESSTFATFGHIHFHFAWILIFQYIFSVWYVSCSYKWHHVHHMSHKYTHLTLYFHLFYPHLSLPFLLMYLITIFDYRQYLNVIACLSKQFRDSNLCVCSLISYFIRTSRKLIPKFIRIHET